MTRDASRPQRSAGREPGVAAHGESRRDRIVGGTPGWRLALCLWLGAAVAQAQDGEVRLQVTLSATGGPAAGAQFGIVDRGQENSKPRQGRAGFDGQYVFRDLAPGEYVVVASRRGYVSDERAASVEGRDSRAEVRLRLRKEAVITGRVVDPDGRPVEQAYVRLHGQYYEAGRLLSYSGSGAGGRTDDRGRYRIFRVRPGAYFVTVKSPRDPSPASEAHLSHESQLYPLATRLSNAERVRVGYDEERTGVDFEIGRALDSTVRIRAMQMEDGGPCAACEIRISQSVGLLSIPVVDGRMSDRGEFTIRGLPRGSYITSGGRIVGNYDAGYVFREAFEVTEPGVQVVGARAWRAPRMHLEAELIDPPEGLKMSVSLFSLEESKLSSYLVGMAGADISAERTTATIEGLVPALYHFRIGSQGDQGYLKALYIAGRRLNEPVFRVTPPGDLNARAEIAFDHAIVTGTAPEGATGVSAVPARHPGYETLRGARVGPDGSFTIDRLIPGEYLVFAHRGGLRLSDPAVQRRHASAAVRLVARPDERHMVNIERVAGE